MSMPCLKLDSRAEEAERLLTWLEPELRSAGLDDMQCFQFGCTVVELVNNSIEHGYEEQAGNPIEVRVIAADDAVTVEVRDRAPRFDPPALAASAGPEAVSGRGYGIILAWSDSFEAGYSENWNHYRVSRRL